MRKVAAAMILMVITLFATTSANAESQNQLVIINKSSNLLAFFDDGKLVKTFKVGTGKLASYTPEGTFEIVNKIKNRPYYKKGIQGGDSDNPLGNRWLGLDARGTYGTTYAIHGNNNASSIGKYVSGGCIRMYNKDVSWLFNHADLYTKVVIGQFKSLAFEKIASKYNYDTSN